MNALNVLSLAVLALAILMQVSCTAAGPEKSETVKEAVVAPPVEQLTARERVRRALDRFQKGEARLAEEDLRAALAEKPDYKLAADLLKQFEVDPQEYLGKDYFEYKVQPGESLSLLAERFLGDNLKFIVLARYNQLAEPGRLVAGQTLRIPERYKPKSAQQALESVAAGSGRKQTSPASARQRQAAYEEVSRMLESGDFAGAVARLEPEVEAWGESDARLLRLSLNAYGAYADWLIGQNRWQDAREILRRATELDPSNERALTQLAMVEDKIEGQRLFAIGKEQEDQGNLEKALRAYQDAAVYDPQAEKYAEAVTRTTDKLAESYHRKAMDLYRREQLDAAKVYWKKVLEIDPDNRIAPGYLSKVEEIQRKIREIDEAD